MQTCICQSWTCKTLDEEKNCPNSNPDEAFDQEDCIKPKPSCLFGKCGVCKTKSGLDEVTRDLSQCTLCELGYKPEIGRNDKTMCTKILDPTYFVSKGGQCTTAYITDAADCNAAARALKLNDENATVAIKTGDPEQDALLYKRPFGCSYDVNAQIDSQLVMNPFGSKTFQDIDSYRSICWINPRCREGQKRVDKKCVACPLNTYRSENDHDFLFCVNQTLCSSGEYITPNSTTAKQQCIECQDNTFQTATYHRIEACTNQPDCGPGEVYVAPATKTTIGACNPCAIGTYQSDDQHRNVKCINHAKCSGTFTGTLIEAGECISSIATNSSTVSNPVDGSTGNGGVIGAAAGGFALILMILMFVFIFATRHAAAKRAQDALNDAREILGIPCKNLNCSECSNIANATPTTPISQQQQQQQQQPATVGQQTQCIQKTSAGTRCCNMATPGSPQCDKHTCQYPGCIISVSSKVPCCKTHANAPSGITISNPAFVGIVLKDVVAGWGGGDSSTDTAGNAAPGAAPLAPAVVEAAEAAAAVKFVAPVMVFGDNTWAATGLTRILGVDERTYKDLNDEEAIKKMVAEFKKSGTKEDQERLDGLINGTYCNPGTTTPLMSLSEMMTSLEVLEFDNIKVSYKAYFDKLKKHGLKSHQVLAIRLYTTDSFISINEPMRTHNKPHPTLPHPFAATMYYITMGLKAIRTAAGADKTESAEERIFWRGVGIALGDDFTSGTEMSCMSTSASATEALKFANENGFLFQIVCNDYYSRGADIRVLSVFPHEKEVLYPPLTYLNTDKMPGAKKANRLAQKEINKLRTLRATLVAYYTKHSPESLADVDTIVQKNSNSKSLFKKLEENHGAKVVPVVLHKKIKVITVRPAYPDT